ncbi:MAG: TonB-dependent receptor [bacterium]
MRRNRTSGIPFVQAAVVLFMLTLFALPSFGQSGTGKISAKLIDEKSGEPLFKASIQIIETKQGALSKDNGIATIINVQPNEDYTVIAKYAGYQPVTLKGIKVKSDQTTKLDFKLSSKTQDTIQVVVDRLVDVSKVGNVSKVAGSEIQTTAGVHNVNDVVALQPGVYRDASNGGVTINGARGNQNSNKINGMESTNFVNGGESIVQSAVSTLAIAEVSVATTGLGAADGNTNGGVISTRTVQGSPNFTMQFRYRQDLPALYGSSSNGFKQMGANDHTYELAFGGPLTQDIRYNITAKGQTVEFSSAGLAVIDPAGNNLGHLPNDHSYLRSATGNLAFDLFGLQFVADVILASTNNQSTGWGAIYGDLSEIPADNAIDNFYTLTTNIPVGTGILKVIGGFQASSNRSGKYDASQGGGLFSLYKLYEANDNFKYDDNTRTVSPGGDGIIDIYTPVSRIIADPRNPYKSLNLASTGINPFTGHIEGPPVIGSANNPFGLYNAFLAAGNVGGFSSQYINQIQLQAQYSDQFGNHGIDAGIEAHLYDIQNYSNSQPWDANPFRDSFTVKPMLADVYIQDKMEFGDITFQPSLRFDIFNPNDSRVILDLYKPIVDKKVVFTTAPVQTQLSPRLGINYAVTDKTLFSFNYGIYFNKPNFIEVISNTGGSVEVALQRGNQIFGNGALKGETDEVIDLGFETGLTDVFKTSVHGIFKKMKNITGLARITSQFLPVGYQIYTDNEYGNYRGIEFSLEKRMSDNYAMKFNYTYSSATGTSSTATSNYSSLINPPSDGETAVLPLQPYSLDFDRTHIAQLLLTALFRRGEGPKISGVSFLENFTFSTTTVLQSGTPYTRFDVKGVQVGEHNGERQPISFETEGTITRNISLADLFGSSMGATSLDIQLEIYNLFNRTVPLALYSTTGQGDDDGVNPTYAGTYDFVNDPTNASGNEIDALGSLKYQPRWDLNKDGRVDLDEQTKGFLLRRAERFQRRTNYQAPRRFYINFALHF